MITRNRDIILLILVVVIAVAPMLMFSGLGEDQGYFGGTDDAAGQIVEDSGFTPWFSSFWEPPSGEIESLLFCTQTAIGAIIIGYFLGYCQAQSKYRKDEDE